MAALGTTQPTLLDFKASLDANDAVAPVIEILNQTNPLLIDIPFVEANEMTGHVTTIRTGIPAPTFRKFYGYVQPTKTTRAKVRDAVAMMENYGQVDKAMADLSGNAAAFRLSEEKGLIEGFGQKAASYFFYGNSDTEPEAFMGLAPRYNSLSAENGENILSGAGATASVEASIYLIGWSPETVFGIYPRGSKAGLSVMDKGQQTLTDSSGGRLEIYETHYKWDLGVCVRDWRYIVRIANIKVGDLTKDASAGADLIDLMSRALDLVPESGQVTWRFYCNRTVKSFIRRQMVAAVKQSTLEFATLAGVGAGTTRKVLAFDGIPIERTDALLSTEAVVS